MADLIFLTDRYPYNNSEAFIENEIDEMSNHFDRIFILPCGLMVNTTTCRDVPSNVEILKPPTASDIFNHKPSMTTKVIWAFKHLLPYICLCLINKYFYRELISLLKQRRLSVTRIVKIFRTLAPSIRNARFYKKALFDYTFNDVYAYSYWIEPTILFADKIVKTKCIKKISRTHRWDLYSEENTANYLAFQKQVIESLDTLYVISQDGCSYLTRKYPELSYKITVSRLGTKDFGLNPSKSSDIFRIVSCSNLIPVKRVDLIIKSLNRIHQKNKIEWVHFGTGQYYDDIVRCAHNELQGVKYIFKGLVTNPEILDYYKENHVDLFINLSSSEGIPVSIMEAASFGIPIIATDVGGTSEIVHDSINGVLINKEFDINDVAKEIDCFINNQYKVEEYRINSRKIWEEQFSCSKNYQQFYNTILQ